MVYDDSVEQPADNELAGRASAASDPVNCYVQR